MTVRIVTWNVNGIRNPFKYSPWNKDRTLQSMFDILEADIVCFQEVKTPKTSLTDDLVFVDGWDTFYSFPHSQTGYSGVAVYTRDSKCIPLRVEEGVTGVLKIPGSQTRYMDALPENQIAGYPTDKQLRRAAVGRDVIDSEGRCLILEFPLFVLINVYCPARRNHERTGYRNTFLLALDVRIRNLAAAGKNVVLCGDLNIMRDQLDTAGIWGHQGQKVLTEALEFDENYLTMRAPKLLNQLLFNSRTISDAGNPFIDESVEKRRPPVLYDTCRELHPKQTGMFTCWDTKKNHRPANFGSRIDFIICSPKIMQLVEEADIQPQLLGSDHCPVYVVLRDKIEDVDTGKGTHTLDYLNPLRRFVDGQLAVSAERDGAFLKRFPQSGRRMPQFSNRRHIASMFRPASKPPTTQEATVPPTVVSNSVVFSTDTALSKLPDIFKADPVDLVESSDDDDGAAIEDDEPAVAFEEEEESEPLEPTTLAEARKDEHSPAPPPTDIKDASSVSSLPSRAFASFLQSPERQPSPTTRTVSVVGSEFMDLPFERGDTPSDDVESSRPSQSQQPFLGGQGGGGGNGTALALPSSVPKSKPPPRRNPPRPRSGAGSSNASSSAASSRPAKKAKTTTGFQTSINMFLQARDRNQNDPPLQQPQKQQQPPVGGCGPSGGNGVADLPAAAAAAADNETSPAKPAAPEAVLDEVEEAWMSAEEVDAAFRNLDAARASWSRLGLGQRQAPLCEHGEPCKTFVTKKAGVNSGRSFYMCARPPGPLGRREKGTAWQCTTFVWCRDWKPERKE